MPSLPLTPDFLRLLPHDASGFVYGLGYLVGAAAFAAMAWRRRLWTEGVGYVCLIGLMGGLIAANITQFLAAGNAGKTVLGGVAGGYLAVHLGKRIIGLRRPTGDLFAVALVAGEAVGRWGCYFGGCCYGKPAPDLPFAVFQHDALRHPAQIYLSVACAAILAVLLYVEFRRPLPENGLFYLQGVLYSAARFVVEFYREGHAAFLGLTLAQLLCLIAFAFFGYRLMTLSQLTGGKRVRIAEL